MGHQTSQHAKETVCWLMMEAGIGSYFCFAEGCSAWEWETAEEGAKRAKKESDLTRHGYCVLLEARCRELD